MVKNRSIQVRLDKDQYAQLKTMMRARGFSSISNYVRYTVLHHDLTLQSKIIEIHQHLLRPVQKNRRSKISNARSG